MSSILDTLDKDFRAYSAVLTYLFSEILKYNIYSLRFSQTIPQFKLPTSLGLFSPGLGRSLNFPPVHGYFPGLDRLLLWVNKMFGQKVFCLKSKMLIIFFLGPKSQTKNLVLLKLSFLHLVCYKILEIKLSIWFANCKPNPV